MTTRRHRRLILTGSITGAVLVALDGTVLTIAQPTLQRDLHASFVQVQWTSTGYLIAVASLLVFAGRLGDRYGHQRLFALGTLGFAATSAGIGLAPGIGWVIGLRVAQGICGALLQPATLGMLRATYPEDQLGMPIALRTSAIGLSAAAGPVLGGALVAHLGWRAVFFLTVLPALVTGAMALVVRVPDGRGPAVRVPAIRLPAGGVPAAAPAPRRVPAAAAPGASLAARLDLLGACLLAVALLCLVYTLVALPESGWTAVTGAGAVTAVAAFGAFLRQERRTASPLVPLGFLGSPPVAAALAVLLSASAALFGTLFVGTYFLQDVLALDPLQSALRVLPLAVMMVLSAPAAAVLQRRHGARRTTVVAMTLLTLGILLLSLLDRSSAAPAIGAAFLLLGAGFGTVMVTATAVIVHQASADHAGVAGGLQQTAMNIGPTLGVALATMLMTLTAPTAAGKVPSVGGLHGTADALTSAMGSTLPALACVAALGALAAGALPHRSKTTGEPQPPTTPAGYGQQPSAVTTTAESE
ncbi:Major Facilitator Superfamily protein [Streptomyces sp. 2323.1]|uniref:MFS transporter n=1 Tax=Streptomyces sp. 2323.1 TaxID=1938841 RepID=UPI000BB6CD63|nr:MFS transporter [Streptomyces sp. 2323.1]SOE10394.1 Major Facilitator Superfamily protein [Streptomyces sp. 2323.1]